MDEGREFEKCFFPPLINFSILNTFGVAFTRANDSYKKEERGKVKREGVTV